MVSNATLVARAGELRAVTLLVRSAPPGRVDAEGCRRHCTARRSVSPEPGAPGLTVHMHMHMHMHMHVDMHVDMHMHMHMRAGVSVAALSPSRRPPKYRHAHKPQLITLGHQISCMLCDPDRPPPVAAFVYCIRAIV